MHRLFIGLRFQTLFKKSIEASVPASQQTLLLTHGFLPHKGNRFPLIHKESTHIDSNQ